MNNSEEQEKQFPITTIQVNQRTPMRTIKVQGKGEVTAAPDSVRLSLDVAVEAAGYAACIDDLNTRTHALRRALASAGLEPAQLKTTDFNVEIKQRYNSGSYEFAGYTAAHKLKIELPLNKEHLNKVLAQLAQSQSGAQIHLSFYVADQNGLKKQVLANAVESARANAEVLASAAGVKLGQLLEMNYGWNEVRFRTYEADMQCEPLADEPTHADVDPDDVSAEDSVTLVFEILDLS